MSTSLQCWRQPLSYLAIAAVLAGIYVRFNGLGSAPLAVDEYYLARSIENVLRTGLPAFKCSGFYTRGIVLQYSAAALQLTGLSAEFAPRLICALASLLCLPAVFTLGQRAQGRVVGLLAVVIIALSVWEIEIARFGRMYAPFQAVFLWYLVFFLRYTVDRNAKALWPMIGLSIIAPLVWEGGVFLPLTNFLALFLQRWPSGLRRSDWIYLISNAALLALAFWFVTADFRGYNANSWPAGYIPSLSAATPDTVTTLELPLNAFRQHPSWMAAAIVPLAGVLFALICIWQLRSRRFLTEGLLAMLLAAVAHQFLVVGAIGLLLLLTRLVNWPELFSRGLLPLHIAIGLCAIFWVLFGISTADWSRLAFGGLGGRAAALGYQFLRFPYLVTVVIRPWAKAVPHLGAALLLLVSTAMVTAAKNEKTPNSERFLLVAFLVLLLAASASHPPREETRYIFFLYPVAIIIALTTITRAAAVFAIRPAVATGLTSAIALGGFALSEDFQPHHLLHIDSSVETFRVGMRPDMQSHLVIREDYRSIALWLQQHRSSQDLVINGVHGLDHYYPEIDYFYIDERSPNFPDWSCRQGTLERWGNYSLLYSVDSLAEKVAASPKVYLVAFSYDRDATLIALRALHPRVAMSSGDVIIIELKG